MFRIRLLLPFVLAVLCVTVTGDLLCYSCISQGLSDNACINNPADVVSVNPIVKCKDKLKYCTVRRYELAADPGTISTFYRGCEEDPLPNGQHVDADGIVWAQSCDFADLCNVGDGLTELTPGNVGNGGGGSGNVIIVPGSSSSRLSGHIPIVVTLLLACASIYADFRM